MIRWRAKQRWQCNALSPMFLLKVTCVGPHVGLQRFLSWEDSVANVTSYVALQFPPFLDEWMNAVGSGASPPQQRSGVLCISTLRSFGRLRGVARAGGAESHLPSPRPPIPGKHPRILNGRASHLVDEESIDAFWRCKYRFGCHFLENFLLTAECSIVSVYKPPFPPKWNFPRSRKASWDMIPRHLSL